jgi:manganese/iron transport system permease protein
MTDPFHYQYMVIAMIACALVGAVGGLLSSFVTLRGWSLVGDALSHAVVPGVVVAYALGWPLIVGAFSAGLLAAGSMSLLKQKTTLREDVIIGIVFTTFFALGLWLISVSPAGIDRKTIIFGNILAISPGELRQLFLIIGASALIVWWKWRDLLLVTFDQNAAQAFGWSVRRLRWLLLILLAAVSVAAIQTVGACLVVAVLITPGATAYLLTDRFGKMMVISSAIGAVTGFVGAYASWFFDGATGGCIVTLQAVVFGLVWLLAPKHGHLAQRRQQEKSLSGGLST